MTPAKSHFSPLWLFRSCLFSSNKFGNLESIRPVSSTYEGRKQYHTQAICLWSKRPAMGGSGLPGRCSSNLFLGIWDLGKQYMGHWPEEVWIQIHPMCTDSTICAESFTLTMCEVYKPREDTLCFVYLFSLWVLPCLEIIPKNLKQPKASPLVWPQTKLILM